MPLNADVCITQNRVLVLLIRVKILKHKEELGSGETNNVPGASLDTLDQDTSCGLVAIGSSLVHGLFGGDVGPDELGGQLLHLDLGSLYFGQDPRRLVGTLWGRGDQGDTGVDHVGRSREAGQHLEGALL